MSILVPKRGEKAAEKRKAKAERDAIWVKAEALMRRLATDDAYREAFNGKPGDEAALRLRLEAAERLLEAVLPRCSWCQAPATLTADSCDACRTRKEKTFGRLKDTAPAALIRAWLTAKGLSK